MDEDGFSLKDSTITIFGLGLMGGSLALALKDHCLAIYGIDSNPSTLDFALANHIVDRAEADPSILLPVSDLIILATPVSTIMDILQALADLMPNPCIVFDLGSTKCLILEAMSQLPDRFEAIGGHPICGKEKLSLENAEASLFRSAPFVITPLKRTTARAYQAAEQVIDAVGSRAIQMDAAEHDRILASTSHLPYLLSSALVSALRSTSTDKISQLMGPGFRSTARLAGTPSSMMLGVLETNRENVLEALHNVQNELNAFESALSTCNSGELQFLLDISHSVYLKYTRS
jgi:prephenate dehydrogenase